MMNFLELVAACGLFIVVTVIAYRLPIVTVCLFIALAIIPTIFQMLPDYVEDYAVIGFGFMAYDVVMLAMILACLIYLLRRKTGKGVGLLRYIVFFSTWLLFEIARNIGAYGLSALGEFRFTYLILSVPVYICLFFQSQEQRRRLFKITIACAVFAPLFCIPVIGFIKGWSTGPDSRFFSSQISLGLFYGLMSLILATSYRMLRFNRLMLILTGVVVMIMVLLDGHRSVWLAAFISLLVLFALRELAVPKFARWGLAFLVVVGLLSFIIPDVGNYLIDYVGSRAAAFINPEQDRTASWRVAIWAASLDKFLAAPWIGEGLGGYWYTPLPQLGEIVTVTPHSFYVQILVKIGIIGFAAYLAMVAKVFTALRRGLIRVRRDSSPEKAVVLMALICLIASHFYYTVYSLDTYTWLFVGLGIASVTSWKSLPQIHAANGG